MIDETANDEELARALSEQFQAEDEAIRRRQKEVTVSNNQHEIPVVIGTVIEEDNEHSIPLPTISTTSTANNQQYIEDELRLSSAFGFNDTTQLSPEEIASRAEQEERDRYHAQLIQQQEDASRLEQQERDRYLAQRYANDNNMNMEIQHHEPIDPQVIQQRQQRIRRKRTFQSALSCIFCAGKSALVLFHYVN